MKHHGEPKAIDILKPKYRLAGTKPSAQWFYRDRFSYGKGLNGVTLDPRLVGRELSARLFPIMLIQQQWQHENKASLVESFISWLSPYLLVLDFLREPQREILEKNASEHAILVDRMYPLYPKVINRQSINAARVEAMLRKANKNSSNTSCAVDTV